MDRNFIGPLGKKPLGNKGTVKIPYCSIKCCVLICFTAQVFSSSDPPPKTTTPEEFIRMTKGITMATAKAVAAGNSCRQEDIIATANLSRRAIADMLHSCKVPSFISPIMLKWQPLGVQIYFFCIVQCRVVQLKFTFQLHWSWIEPTLWAIGFNHLVHRAEPLKFFISFKVMLEWKS